MRQSCDRAKRQHNRRNGRHFYLPRGINLYGIIARHLRSLSLRQITGEQVKNETSRWMAGMAFGGGAVLLGLSAFDMNPFVAAIALFFVTIGVTVWAMC